MENQNAENNVVSLFGARNATNHKEVSARESGEEETEIALDDAIRKNEENRRRLMKDRLKANKSVLKSYRIKKN